MSVVNPPRHTLLILGVHNGDANSSPLDGGGWRVAFSPNIAWAYPAAMIAVLDGKPCLIVNVSPSPVTTGFMLADLKEIVAVAKPEII